MKAKVFRSEVGDRKWVAIRPTGRVSGRGRQRALKHFTTWEEAIEWALRKPPVT